MSRQDRITQLIKDAFNLNHLSVENESDKHHVPINSETHFKLVVISEDFEGMSIIQRHRKINALLSHELETGLHALTLHLHTPQEWQKRNQLSMKSPSCKEGYDRDEITKV